MEIEKEFLLFYHRDVEIETFKMQIDNLTEQLIIKEKEYNNLNLHFQKESKKMWILKIKL